MPSRNKPLLSLYCYLLAGIIMIKDERRYQSRSHCVIYSTSLATQRFCTKTTHNEKRRREKSAKNLSAAELLNKYLSVLYNANSLILALIKVDC